MDISHGLTLYVLLFSLLMGLISFASPCILPLIPSYVSYITGISYDELVSRESRKKEHEHHAAAFAGICGRVFDHLCAAGGHGEPCRAAFCPSIWTSSGSWAACSSSSWAFSSWMS